MKELESTKAKLEGKSSRNSFSNLIFNELNDKLFCGGNK